MSLHFMTLSGPYLNFKHFCKSSQNSLWFEFTIVCLHKKGFLFFSELGFMLRWQRWDAACPYKADFLFFWLVNLVYGVEMWGLRLNKANHWKDLGRPLVSMIARVIRSKASVPHDIIRAEMGATPIITEALFRSVTCIIRAEKGAAPIITEALFRSVTCIQHLWEPPKQRYPRLTLMSSRQLGENGDIHCWYAEMQQWSESHCISINAPPPFRYSWTFPIYTNGILTRT